MNLRRLLTSITFLLVFFLALRVSVDPDTWWHMKTGQWIVQHQAIPTVDPFSYTRSGEAWDYPALSWFSETLIYLLFERLGIWALNVFVALLVTAAFAFIYRCLTGGLFLKAFVLLLAVITSGVYWAARPYMFSFVCAAATLWVLEDFRTRRAQRLWLLPLIMLVWVNSHPGFAIGFLLVAIYGAGELVHLASEQWPIKRDGWRALWAGIRPLVIGGTFMLLAGCINADGIAGLRYPFDTLGIEYLPLIKEWQSPDFHVQSLLPFMLMIFVLLAALGASRKRMAATHWLLLVVLTYLSLTAARNIALFALAAPIVICEHLAGPLLELNARLGRKDQAAEEKPGRAKAALNWAIVLLMAAATVLRAVQVGGPEMTQEKLASLAPLGAVEYIQREQPEGRLFNSYNWGGYLIWALPEYPVFIDGRTDLYADGLLGDWLSIVRGEDGWQEALASWDVHMVLIEPEFALAQLLPYEGWQVAYRDEYSVLFVR